MACLYTSCCCPSTSTKIEYKSYSVMIPLIWNPFTKIIVMFFFRCTDSCSTCSWKDIIFVILSNVFIPPSSQTLTRYCSNSCISCFAPLGLNVKFPSPSLICRTGTSPVMGQTSYSLYFCRIIDSPSTNISTKSFFSISKTLLVSLGMTIRPKWSIFRKILVDFNWHSPSFFLYKM